MRNNYFKRFLPDIHHLRNRWYMRPFDAVIHDPALWHMNRRGVAKGVALGFFIGSLPLPGHMLTASLLALYLRVNLPVSVGAVWISNPFTIGPMFYFAYRLGLALLDMAPIPVPAHLSFGWMMSELEHLWIPMALGSVILGSIYSLTGYTTVNLLWQFTLRRRYRLRHKTGSGKPG